jgi:transposase
MTNPANRIEVVTSVQRRRRWRASEKVRMVEETFAPGMTVRFVARQHGVAPNQLFTWRRLVAQGTLTAAGSGKEVVPASDCRALQNQIRELHRLLGKKTLEAEILKEALEQATGSKKRLRLPRCRRRTIRDEGRGRSDRRVPLEPGGAFAAASAEIGCDNGERVRVAFALDCCDREAMSFLATTGGISGDDVRDLMVAAVEHRFGRVNRLPATIGMAVRQR